MYDKVFYSITAREIILEWDKTACRLVFPTGLGLAFFEEDLDSDLDLTVKADLDLDLAVAGLVTSLIDLGQSLVELWSKYRL